MSSRAARGMAKPPRAAGNVHASRVRRRGGALQALMRLRSSPVPTIWTIGYEKLLPPELAAELQAAGVERVIDVRFRPQSRRPGMSKTRLGELLGDHGIAYEHRRALGTPADLRHLFHAGKVAEAATAFRAHIEATAADELDALAAELVHAPPT